MIEYPNGVPELSKRELTEEQIENRRLWIEALCSGNFKQGRALLYSKDTDAYCCLGVGCKVMGFPVLSSDNLERSVPISYKEFRKAFGLVTEDINVFIQFNDSLEYSFKRIADEIKKVTEFPYD